MNGRVVDVGRTSVARTDRFLLDTNVVYQLVGPLQPVDAKLTKYSDFLTRALRAEASLYVSVLTFYELVGLIERERFYLANGRPMESHEKKIFRRDGPARASVVERVREAWEATQQFAEVLPVEVARTVPEDRDLPLLERSYLDGYDPLLLASAVGARPRINNIVTNDRDFLSVPEIIVWTA